MAALSISGTVLSRNDTASNWTTENPTLGKGEIGIEIDTRRGKVGDGLTAWNSLNYAWNYVTFETDTNGDLMPCADPQASDTWEIDANGDIMPI